MIPHLTCALASHSHPTQILNLKVHLIIRVHAMSAPNMGYANYLPDELLLEIVAHIRTWERLERQTVLARFSAVNR